MLDHWIRAQRIAAAAYFLGLPLTGTRQAQQVQLDAKERFAALLTSELEEGRTADPQFYRSLPPLSLELATSIPQGLLVDFEKLKRLQPSLCQALDELNTGNAERGHAPRGFSARVVAHFMLHSQLSVAGLRDLGRKVFHKGLHRFDGSTTDSIEEALSVLRSSSHMTWRKIEAVDVAIGLLGPGEHLPHVATALYHSLFAWPLLVAEPSRIALSLPVIVDVETGMSSGNFVEALHTGHRLIQAADWTLNFERAAKAAVVLWSGKHSNTGAFRDTVKRARVTFDFELAERVIRGFPYTFPLDGSSADAYFSQVILSRLLGGAMSSARIVTGAIGNQRSNALGPDADFEFRWAESIVEKMRFVFTTQLFDRIILPSRKALVKDKPQRAKEIDNMLASRDVTPTAETNFVEHLQHVADAFQVHGWRQFRYVRCPDVAWRIHPSGATLPDPKSSGVQLFLQTLRANQSAVLEFDDASVRDLASALWNINVATRSGTRSSGGPPPMLSWTFVRAVPQEQDLRFWEATWRAMNAPLHEFESLASSLTTDAAARCIADALNRFEPMDGTLGYRSPDLLVVLGSEQLRHGSPKDKVSSAFPLKFEAVLERLKTPEMLRPVPYDVMRDRVGSTRIIVFRKPSIVNDDSAEIFGRERVEYDLAEWLGELLGPEGEWESLKEAVLNYLSVFRFEFTYQMARLLLEPLGLSGQRLVRILQRLVQEGGLREVFGRYYVPGQVGNSSCFMSSDDELAQLHFSGAISYAPYLSVMPVPSLLLEESFRPEYIHEANYHLREAYRLCSLIQNQRLQSSVNEATHRLLLFAELPSWSNVHELTRLNKTSRKEAYKRAITLLDADRKASIPTHPMHLIFAAQALEKWFNQAVGHPMVSDHKREGLLNEIEYIYQNALDLTSDPLKSGEHGFLHVQALTSYAALLAQHASSLRRPELMDKSHALSLAAQELLQQGVDGSGIPGAWYEQIADSLEPHPKAMEVYRLGTKWCPRWYQLWIKLIGAALCGHSNSYKAQEVCRSLSTEDVELMLKRSLPAFNSQHNRAPKWVKERWTHGIKQLEKVFGQNASIQKLLGFYQIKPTESRKRM